MKKILLRILQIVTMPIRLAIAILFGFGVICAGIPLVLIFSVGSPELILETLRELLDCDWREIAHAILFGMTD